MLAPGFGEKGISKDRDELAFLFVSFGEGEAEVGIELEDAEIEG